MYGWRARVGVILPIDNTVLEPELYGSAFDGVSFHVVRLPTSEREEMPKAGVRVAPQFEEMGVDAVVYACAETSFLNGNEGNTAIMEAITAAVHVPTITATWAMVLAMRELGAVNIGLVSPYTAERGAVMEGFLERSGISVIRAEHRDFNEGVGDRREWYPTNVQHPSVAYRSTRKVAGPDLDAILISATNFRTFDVLVQAAADTGLPVVSCNQAILWWLGHQLGLTDLQSFCRSPLP